MSSVQIKFDINRWFEQRREREREKYTALAQAHCPHFEIQDVGTTEDSHLAVAHQGLMITTYGTTAWHCKRCAYVAMVYSAEEGVARIEAWLTEDRDLKRWMQAWDDSGYYIRRANGIDDSWLRKVVRFVFGGRR